MDAILLNLLGRVHAQVLQLEEQLKQAQTLIESLRKQITDLNAEKAKKKTDADS